MIKFKKIYMNETQSYVSSALTMFFSCAVGIPLKPLTMANLDQPKQRHDSSQDTILQRHTCTGNKLGNTTVDDMDGEQVKGVPLL